MSRLVVLCLVGGMCLFGCGVFPGLGGDDDPYEPGRYVPPSGPYCDVVATWDADWEAFEDEVLRLTNERRAAGASCGAEGTFPPAAALAPNQHLRCSARNHSMDMALRDFFEHDNLDGETPFDRIDKTGYQWIAAGENIAAGQATPADVISTWMASDGHCRNIMSGLFTELGVGYYFDSNDAYRHYWTQNFGTPP